MITSAMVLCAGLGTRFRPLTERLPKPAIPFFGAPLIRYSFALLKNAGVERVVINTHHLPEIMEAVARAEARELGLAFVSIHEPEIQGTGGALRGARDHLKEAPFYLLNGDAFMSLDLRTLGARHQESGAAATLALSPMPPGESFGAVEMSADGSIRALSGHGPGGENLTPWHFLGAHVIEPTIFDYLPAGSIDINHVVYPAMVEAGERILGAPMAVGAWADLGSPARYLNACADLLTGRNDLSALGPHAPLTPEEQAQLRAESRAERILVDATARLGDRVCLEHAIVGADTVIGAEARIRDSVVMPETRIGARETLDRTIAYQELRLT